MFHCVCRLGVLKDEDFQSFLIANFGVVSMILLEIMVRDCCILGCFQQAVHIGVSGVAIYFDAEINDLAPKSTKNNLIMLIEFRRPRFEVL